MGNFLLLFFHFPLATKRKGKDWFGWCIKKRGARFSLSLLPVAFSPFLPPFPRELRSFPIARGWCRGKEKKFLLFFDRGKLFVRLRKKKKGALQTSKVFCSYERNFVVKARGPSLYYVRLVFPIAQKIYECTYVGWLDASCGCDSEREKRK